MILLISYDLVGHERPQAYDEVIDRIGALANDHIRPLYSQFLVETSHSPAWWTNALEGVIDSDDGLLIVQVVDRGYYGYLNTSVWSWLSSKGIRPAN